MGAFGSCLGVGRPNKPGVNGNPRFVGQPGEPGSFGGPGVSGKQLLRVRQGSYLHNGLNSAKDLVPKLLRQPSSLSGGHHQQLPPHPAGPPFNHQNVTPLLDFDTDFDSNNNIQNNNNNNSGNINKPQLANSHLICNRKTILGANNALSATSASTAAAKFAQSLKMNPVIKNLVAAYDYEAKSSEDLAFNKGDHLETTVALMEGDWWVARSKSSKQIGFVPSNYVYELKSLEGNTQPAWYLGRLGRAEAEMRLKMPANKDGSFVIRDSDTSTHTYSLSLKHENDVKHYRIKQFEAGGFYINKKVVFSTIYDLVLHYSQNADGLCINLREACAGGYEPAELPGDVPDQYEIDRNRLTLLHELGRGQFGQVYEGLLDGKTRVAIKTLRKDHMSPQDFLAEAQIMKNMKHRNLVRLFCVCTREEPVYIITELMSKGALISYLQTDEGKRLPLSECIKMATQIADGMSYIESEKYVHRDLAARNILVGEDNICKIADFGLARFIKETEYEAKQGARFPIKWTAPEAANYSKFTIKSDVWSFGIVLYEIITKGGTPYPDMTNAEVLNQIDRGYRMPPPPGCEAKYYTIMVDCWNKTSNLRPTFVTLHDRLENYFESDQQYREAFLFRNN